ncbi:glycosyltransferase family 39 protein [Candidatus Pacearchaeota archaeon]|nr:glycosyltransferase family 39 protein [Candidatus Pacearchaeota archaeon]
MNLVRKYRFNLKPVACAGVLVCVLVTFSYYCLFDEPSVVVFYLLCLMVGLGISLLLSPKNADEKELLINLFLIVYAINIIFVFLFVAYFYHVNGTPFLPAHGNNNPDDLLFYKHGIRLADAWHNNYDHGISLGEIKFYGYTYLLGGIFYLSNFFGDMSPVTPRIFNAMIGGLIPVVVYLLAKLIYNKKIALRSAITSTLFPVFIYYSALILRDIVVAFLILLSTYLFLVIHKSHCKIKILFLTLTLCAGIILIFFMRDLSAFVLLMCFVAFLFLKKKAIFKGAVLLLFGLMTITIWHNLDFDAQKIQQYLTYSQRYMELFQTTEAEDSLGMKYILGAPFPINIPLTFAYTSIMPIPPTKYFDFHSAVLGSGAFLWYFIFPFWLYGMWASRKYPEANLLTIISIIFLLGISMASIDIRHKTQFFSFALIQASYAAEFFQKKKTVIYFFTAYVIGSLSIVYLYLKFL